MLLHFPLHDCFLLTLASGLLFLYAETHYSFKGIYSRLKKKEPEILADVPYRNDPGLALPVLILVKDADRYPIRLQKVEVLLTCRNREVRKTVPFDSRLIEQQLWFHIIEIPAGPGLSGACRVDVTICFAINGVARTVRNDNYAGTSHAPFETVLSETGLPAGPGWRFGEFHCHTSYTSDQVEFGAPLAATRILAQRMGLSFFCATDHSYDLDDCPDDYLKNDPALVKWWRSRADIAALNRSRDRFVIVPGEEVSAGNGKNRNVHFLILNHPDFLPGDGDSAEKWLRTKPTLSIPDILETIGPEALAFAAHPAVSPPFLEWLLVRRGRWEPQDCGHARLHGLQIWNGTEAGFEEGKRIWIGLLLRGRRVFIAAGNDAHGNFNRFRQIGIPFLTMREHRGHIFGKVRTGVYIDGELSLGSLLAACRKGRMVVTDGPFVDLRASNESGQVALPGDALTGADFELEIACRSTSEFGELTALKIWVGNLDDRQESLFRCVTEFQDSLTHRNSLRPEATARRFYVRAELYSRKAGETLKCLTNPIWLVRTNIKTV